MGTRIMIEEQLKKMKLAVNAFVQNFGFFLADGSDSYNIMLEGTPRVEIQGKFIGLLDKIKEAYGDEENKELKRGQKVVIYSSDSRQRPEVVEITSLGKKYITVNATRDKCKYDREDLGCVDWRCWSIFPGTLEEYEEWRKNIDEVKKLRDECQQAISRASDKKVRIIHKILQQL